MVFYSYHTRPTTQDMKGDCQQQCVTHQEVCTNFGIRSIGLYLPDFHIEQTKKKIVELNPSLFIVGRKISVGNSWNGNDVYPQLYTSPDDLYDVKSAHHGLVWCKV